MCGVPYHSAENYIQRLIEKGYKVAICEQMEEASATKGMVRRDIVRVVTPGTVMEGKVLGDKSNNYMVCVTETDGMLALAACDLSTGELYVTSVPDSKEWLLDEINIYEPSEMLGDGHLLDFVASRMSPLDGVLCIRPGTNPRMIWFGINLAKPRGQGLRRNADGAYHA